MNAATEQPARDPVPAKPSRKNRVKVLIGYASLAAIAAAVCIALHISDAGAEGAAAPAPLPTVGVSAPLQRSLEPRLEFEGQVSPVENLEIRAQVGGTLSEIRFKDGDVVHKGDVLFVIDPTPYQIKLSQATAELESARARLTLATRQLARAQQLKATDAGSVENVDQATAEKLAAQAAVDGGEALVRDAKFDLDRCTISAPFTGRIGTHLVSVGNLISGSRAGSGPTTLLTTLVSVDPVYVNFDMSEADYMTFLRERTLDHGPLANKVYISLTGDTRSDRSGTMTFIDNALDRSSGTIHARATVTNTDLVLTPGAFARVQLALEHPAATLLVPDASVLPDQTEHEVLVVAADGTVGVKKVEVGDLRGGLRVIRSGLAPTDQVIVDGIPVASPGAKVKTTAGTIRFDATQDRG
jgi:RND family efflux transporter MFP subunit